MNAGRLPTYYISHGGGPWPYMKEEMPGVYDALDASLKDIPRQIGGLPDAILVISGHWEEPRFTVMSSPKPPMIYDYAGFPDYTYEVLYAAPGAPEIARRVKERLEAAGFPAALDPERGFDHGTFAPLASMLPDANVPVVELSIRDDYDPAAHIKMGQALAPFRDERVLILGSGVSYHNLRAMGTAGTMPSREWDAWLTDTIVNSIPDERTRRLINWEKAPSARFAHPREDHLIPLMAAAGAAHGDKAERVYHEDDFFGGVAVSSYRFG